MIILTCKKYIIIGTEIKPARSSRKQMRKREDSGGHVYPVDLWFTLASYIDPDAVGRFAVLCQDSYLVTKTRQFWKNLYTRYMCVLLQVYMLQ